MKINTFYWDDRIINKRIHNVLKKINFKSSALFSYGNCGDIFNKDLLLYIYGQNIKINNTHKSNLLYDVVYRGKKSKPTNKIIDENRILLVGSLSHFITDGDVLSGIGTKYENIAQKSKDVYVNALRGPISEKLFKQAGYNTSTIKFLYDPGLLIRYMYPLLEQNPSGAIFIPHFSERYNYANLPKGIRFCDIDNTPQVIAQQILNAEIVYSSSLHGIIFAHSLGRRAVMVKPPSAESLIKYKDYYASVNLPFPKPLNSINDANFIMDDKLPFEINIKEDDFKFPSIDALLKRKIAF